MNAIVARLKFKVRAAVILLDRFLFGTDNAKVAIKTKILNEFTLHMIIRLPNPVFAPYTSIAANTLFFAQDKLSRLFLINFGRTW